MKRALLLGLSLWLAACQNTGPTRDLLAPTQALGTATLTEQLDHLDAAIRHADFAAASRQLSPCLTLTSTDRMLELQCARLYAGVAVLDDGFLSRLHSWVGADDANYHARLILAEVNSHAAWVEQGRHYPRNTPPLYRQRATALRNLSQAHYRAAQALRPDLPYAYAGLIRSLSEENLSEATEQLYQRARLWTPSSLVVTAAYLDANQPRWLGSYAKLDSVVTDYRDQQGRGPASAWVAAYADLLKTWAPRLDSAARRNPTQAVERLNRLSAQGYDWPRLEWALADANARLGKMDAARHHILAAVEAAPYDEFILGTAACTCYGLALDEAIGLNEQFVERYPPAFYGWRNLARDYLNRGDHRATLNAAEKALSLRPLDTEMQRYENGARMTLGLDPRPGYSIEDYRQLVLEGLQLETRLAEVRDTLRAQAQPRLNAAEQQQLDRALVDHLTGADVLPSLRQRLDKLDWNLETWRAVSTFLFDQADTAGELDDDYRRQVRLRFTATDDTHAVAELDRLFRAVVEARVQDFIYRQSQRLPLTSGGMTS